MITDLQTDGKTYLDNNGLSTTRGLREHSLKIWASSVQRFRRRCEDKLDNKTKRDGRTNERMNKNERSYRDHPLRGDLKSTIWWQLLKFFLFVAWKRWGTSKIVAKWHFLSLYLLAFNNKYLLEYHWATTVHYLVM